jgi:hypothetical protein
VELEQRILTGFSQWKERHEVRVKAARDEMLSKNGVVSVWEKDVQRLNAVSAYNTHSRLRLMRSLSRRIRSSRVQLMRARTSGW